MSRLTLGKDCHQYLIEEKLKANVRKLNITQLVHVCVCSVAQSCPTLCNPMDCSLSGSSVQGIFPGKNTGVGCHFLLQGSFLTQGVNPCPLHLLHCLGDSLTLYHLVNFIVGLYRSASQYLCCRNLYAGQEATVNTGHGTTDWFQIGKGVCQGCILSPCLFNFYAQYIMGNAGLDEAQLGSRLPGEIPITSDMQITPPSWQKVKKN